MKRKTHRIAIIAELVGYDLESHAWRAEPEALDAAVPGLASALNDLFYTVALTGDPEGEAWPPGV